MMNARFERVGTVMALVAAFAMIGCRTTVQNVHGTHPPNQYRPYSPYTLVAGVTGPGGQASSGLASGFADFLVNEQVVEEVVYPYDPQQHVVDVVFQVDAQGQFERGGAANFFTYLPGGLLLLPTFRGVRWVYDTSAEVKAIDARTGQPIGQYKGAASYRSVDRGNAFGHFFGTLIIVPSLIQGIRHTKPHRSYTDMLYAAAYPHLWKTIAAQVVAQDAEYAAIGAESAERRQYAQPAPDPYGPSGGGGYGPGPGPGGGGGGYGYAPAPGGGRPPGPPPAPVQYGELYSKQVAVVIGVESYQDRDRVSGARADGGRVATQLRSAGFSPVIEVYDQDATRQRVMELLGNELAGHVDENSLVFVYFAGHGETETLPGGSKKGYILPWDADDDFFATGIPMDAVQDLSNRMTAKHVMYAIDACYSGISKTRGIRVPERNDSDYLRKITRKRAVQLFVAGKEGEERVQQNGQSLFSNFLMRGIHGEADLDGDGAVTSSELRAYLVPEVSRASGNRQTPDLATWDGAGEVVFLPFP